MWLLINQENKIKLFSFFKHKNEIQSGYSQSLSFVISDSMMTWLLFDFNCISTCLGLFYA